MEPVLMGSLGVGTKWVRPDESGVLLLSSRDPAPGGYRLVENDPMRFARGGAVYVPEPTWRLWAAHYALQRLRWRVTARLAFWMLAKLCRLVGIDVPIGHTLEGAARAIGAQVEADRRYAA